MAKSPPMVLAFAASDPTGGAGVQADLLTLAARGCHPLSVVTGLTVQDTHGVRSLHPVAAGDLTGVMRQHLFPLTSVATPNSIEAQRFGGANAMLAAGCRYVLVTGTHDDDADVVNRLWDADGLVREDRWPRLPGSYHGSGCTLASALAAALAKGLAMPEAAR